MACRTRSGTDGMEASSSGSCRTAGDDGSRAVGYQPEPWRPGAGVHAGIQQGPAHGTRPQRLTAWVPDYSNDPAVIREARKALQPFHTLHPARTDGRTEGRIQCRFCESACRNKGRIVASQDVNLDALRRDTTRG